MKNRNLWLIFASVILVIFAYGLLSTPSFKDLKALAVGSDKILLDNHGSILQQTRTEFGKRRLPWLPSSAFSKILKEDVIYIEDKRFYSHLGVDLIALVRAFVSNATGGRVQGASTITMQLTDLIKPDVLLNKGKIVKGSYFNKIGQIFRSFFIELKWSKEEILEAYLNLIHLRGEHQGMPAFTYAYFKKSPTLLSSEEALVTASLIRKPNISSDRLVTLACQYQKGRQPQYNCEKLNGPASQLKNGRIDLENDFNMAPHLLQKIQSMAPNQTDYRSFVDSDLQKTVHEILEKNLTYLQGHNVSDMAAVVLENSSGKVLAYIGAIDKYSKAKHVDGADAPRQAGSTLKPFLYGKAIESKLITPASIIMDEPTVLTWNGETYRPSNYDNKFHGPVTARQALASSLNIPAIKMVTMLGLQETYDAIANLKISDLQSRDHYGASIALGAVEVRLHELANIYRSLSQQGLLTPLQWAEGVATPMQPHQIMSPQVAFIMESILSDPNARRIGFGWNSALETSFWTAAKTGTSKALRDNWCVGISQLYTVAVWAGNFSSESMQGVSGVSGAGPSWFEIMQYLHRNKKSLAPEKPEGIVKKNIRFDWGAGEQTEYFLTGTEPKDGLIKLRPDNQINITFPTDQAVITIDPHINKSKKQTVFVRYKGTAPQEAQVFLNGELKGKASNPFKIRNLTAGKYHLEIKDRDQKLLDESHFTLF
ncbi:MAG: penicillin-binding protein 1C [Bdellovibrionales bacterium]|nr:penicillin-binding protein 1C [Bdellovibrionales bacterium]